MSHPVMFDEDDPLLARVRQLAFAFPGAQEKISHGRPVMFTTKVFCHYGGSIKVDGQYVQHPQSIIVKLPEDERRSLLTEPRCYAPAYLAAAGWVGVDLDEHTDWDEVAELLDESYRLTAPRSLVAEHDRMYGQR
ncbi:MmcQ/YjbR family DNA-binding protein [Aestuariimicrobium ganziense]|uniref:MmcQ/YjbR family DNA-binding protein n=1 Tax=Aestuariimicrobium ganziense TaxID=2773677 RepID=UPI0019439002|nr:MmcQ/YjbR family DNA-binding protein [Aestuariimicrobium ganziense]